MMKPGRTPMLGLLLCLMLLGASLLDAGWLFKRKKYENPINKDTQQPDKVLFDKSIKDIERGRYETARLTLNTLINTYDSSEFLAKAKLAIADSWMRQGGPEGLAQAEAEFKDFQLFYPTMPEAPEAQAKICEIHFMRMEKADRDPNNALRAEQECKQLMVQYPNSKFAPKTEQRLREIQETLAQAEMVSGTYYFKKGSFSAAANRLSGLVTQYPLYSDADQALWMAGDAYTHMGPRFKQRAYDSYAKIIRNYPLSEYAELSRKKLRDAEQEIPSPDPAAVERMKFEAANHKEPGLMHRSLGFMRRGPEVSSAAKSGAPTMDPPKREIPANVPVPAEAAGFQGDVTVAPVTDNSALETKPDARPAAPTAGDKPAADAKTTDNPTAGDASSTNSPAAAPAATTTKKGKKK